ncbi:hypothetical protein FisN_4Hh224 [Fistulifera solaris]|uniref:Uncharacterized protein n=1 Tax=Fistulifera solaris TaxID=1519565 RepID=A0A1Z5KEP4_FISSO|nr:hypothetical protein FisN_4Hh224 [Fistulifera solaris]|eukprot:GAX24666.1 hypothetical protein FisN_4Hh224 [Fistulifera solaris]
MSQVACTPSSAELQAAVTTVLAKVPGASAADIQQEVEAHHPTWQIQSLRLRKYIRRARREMDIMQDLSVSSVTGTGDEDVNHIFGFKGVIQQAGMFLSPFSKRRRPSKTNFIPDTIQSFDERDTERDSPVTVDSSLEPTVPSTPTLEETKAASRANNKEILIEGSNAMKQKDLYVDDNDGKKDLCEFCEKCSIL